MLLNSDTISDTSCLILLSKIGELDLLKKVAGIERRSEEQLVEWHSDVTTGLRSQIFKVPHHGSFTSSHTEFLDAVSPELRVDGIGPARLADIKRQNIVVTE